MRVQARGKKLQNVNNRKRIFFKVSVPLPSHYMLYHHHHHHHHHHHFIKVSVYYLAEGKKNPPNILIGDTEIKLILK